MVDVKMVDNEILTKVYDVDYIGEVNEVFEMSILK